MVVAGKRAYGKRTASNNVVPRSQQPRSWWRPDLALPGGSPLVRGRTV